MNTLTHPHTEQSERPSTLRLVVNAVGVLAFVTGLLYGRVLVGDPLLADPAGGLDWRAAVALLVLAVTLAALVLAWRRTPLAWLVTLAGGASLALIMAALVAQNRWLFGFFYGSPFVVAGALFALERYLYRPNG